MCDRCTPYKQLSEIVILLAYENLVTTLNIEKQCHGFQTFINLFLNRMLSETDEYLLKEIRV